MSSPAVNPSPLPVPPTELLNASLRMPEPPSRARLWLRTLLFVAAVFIVNVLLDRLLLAGHESWRFAAETDDLLTAVFAGLLFYRLLVYERERRAWLRQRLEIIAEINHYVRNGLQAISLSQHSATDQQHVRALREGIGRVEYALKEILPKLQ